MRVVPYVIVLFMLVTLFGVYNVYYLNKTSVIMDDVLSELDKAVKTENWNGAEKALKTLENNWGKSKIYWSVLINHSEVDNIEQSIERIKQYIRLNDPIETSAETAGLRRYFLHIPENEKLTIENIF